MLVPAHLSRTLILTIARAERKCRASSNRRSPSRGLDIDHAEGLPAWIMRLFTPSKSEIRGFRARNLPFLQPIVQRHFEPERLFAWDDKTVGENVRK